jgi:hypothetical protein
MAKARLPFETAGRTQVQTLMNAGDYAVFEQCTLSGRIRVSIAICSGLLQRHAPAIPLAMGSKSRETIYCASVRAAAERATDARKEADHPACL